MNIAELSGFIFAGACLAGFVGSITGLGGGVVLVPLLALGFGIDIRYAIGASLVSVIATSSGAAVAYVREGYSNIRAGMFLEVATVLGGTLGAFLTTRVSTGKIAIVFGFVLLFSLIPFRTSDSAQTDAPGDPLARRLRFNSSYPTAAGPQEYTVRRVPLGFTLMGIAGTLSGLLGIGSGAVKVLAMDRAMGFPFKVSTTTSNFMIGVTAAASAGIYLNRGYIDPGLAMPTMLGVLLGALLGTRVLVGARTRVLRWIFDLVILALGLEMIYNGFMGKL
ncbi:MAG TPA: sulfite exporter TauE/SafE family protein [Syntrophales bacterium]|nr:sulfite exporter TauE/SafE family protein [Syntrophales bacterium]